MRILIVTMLCVVFPVYAVDEPRREMWEESSHQLVFQQGDVRILDVRIVPGVTSEFHSHYFATVYILINDALMLNQNSGEEWGARIERPYGKVGSLMNRADYVETNTYHRVRNTDDRTFHLLAIVNGADPVVDVAPVPANENSDLLNNGWFREHRVLLGPGATSDELTLENDAVLVQIDNEGHTFVSEEGITHSAKSESGAWSWHPAGSTFQVVNGSEYARELVVVEVRQQR